MNELLYDHRTMMFRTVVVSSPSESGSSRKCASHGVRHLNNKEVCSFETSVAFYQSTRRNITEYLNLHQLRYLNLKSRKQYCGLDVILT